MLRHAGLQSWRSCQIVLSIALVVADIGWLRRVYTVAPAAIIAIAAVGILRIARRGTVAVDDYTLALDERRRATDSWSAGCLTAVAITTVLDYGCGAIGIAYSLAARDIGPSPAQHWLSLRNTGNRGDGIAAVP
jgi:hypothetical protein